MATTAPTDVRRRSSTPSSASMPYKLLQRRRASHRFLALMSTTEAVYTFLSFCLIVLVFVIISVIDPTATDSLQQNSLAVPPAHLAANPAAALFATSHRPSRVFFAAEGSSKQLAALVANIIAHAAPASAPVDPAIPPSPDYHNLIVTAAVNFAYRKLAINFVCNLHRLNVSNYIILAMDRPVYEYLSLREVNVFFHTLHRVQDDTHRGPDHLRKKPAWHDPPVPPRVEEQHALSDHPPAQHPPADHLVADARAENLAKNAASQNSNTLSHRRANIQLNLIDRLKGDSNARSARQEVDLQTRDEGDPIVAHVASRRLLTLPSHPLHRESHHMLDNMDKPSRFGTAAFLETSRRKSMLVLRILSLGHSVLFSDVDTIWIRNPIPAMFQHSADFVLQSDRSFERPDAPLNHNINSGLYLARASQRSVVTMRAIIRYSYAVRRSEQKAFNYVLCGAFKDHLGGSGKRIGDRQCANARTGATAEVLPLEEFPNGSDHSLWEADSRVALSHPRAVVVHANFVEGREEKVQRIHNSGFWFHSEASLTRDECILPSPPT